MSKSAITRLFLVAILVEAVGVVVGLAAVIAALVGGAVVVGGPTLVGVNSSAVAGSLPWLILAAAAVSAGSLASLASWIGALANTVQLDDKTWFVALLVLGLFSIGFVAMVAYVVAGPDGTRQQAAQPSVA